MVGLDDDISFNILLPAAGFFLIYYILYNKYIFSFLDALFLFIFNLSFSSVLVINAIEDPRYITHFFYCQFFLFLGFAVAQKLIVIDQKSSMSSFSFYEFSQFKYTTYILFAIYVLSNLIIFYTKGFALLLEDTNVARIANFQEGFGIFRKINWAIGSFLCAALTILYLLEVKRIYIFLMLIMAIFIALEGSKSSLLRIMIIAALLINHPFFSKNKRAVNVLKKFAPLALGALALVIYIILSQSGNDFGLAFLQRLLYGADSVLYFYQPPNEYMLTDYGFVDYFDHIINPLLGFFRLATYNEAIGNIMVENLTPPSLIPDIISGPNTPYYIEGQIYFGYYGAFFYSFLIGAAYSYIRQLFFSLRQSSFFFFALACALCFHGSNILIETTLFITNCFDTCFFTIPVYIAVCLAVNGRFLVHPIRFDLLKKPLIPPIR